MSKFNAIKDNPNSTFSFGIGKAIFYALVAGLVMQIIGGIITLPAVFYKVLNHVLLPFGFFIGILAAIGTLLGLLKSNFTPILNDLKSKVSFTEVVLSIFIWLGFLPLVEFLTTLVPTTGALEELYKQFTDAFLSTLDYKIAGFITICILAPIFEEILFRGIILKGMLNAKVNPVVAIIIGGLIFGLIHLNPWQFIGAGLLGAIFGFIYYRTKSLIIPILLHAINNAVSYFIMLNSGDMEEMIFDTTDYLSIGIFSGLGIIVAFILYRITEKKINN